MNQETEKAQGKPVLNAESFQRLLSAACILQVHNDRQRSVQPVGSGRTSFFAATAIVQKRSPSVRSVPPVEFAAPRRTNILLGRPMFWRTVETLAIGMIFCMMMGLAIHRLSALPGRASLSPETTELRSASHATVKVLASPHPVMTRNSRQSSVGGEGDRVAEDIVIRYGESAANLSGQAAKKLTSGLVQEQPFPPKNTTPKLASE